MSGLKDSASTKCLTTYSRLLFRYRKWRWTQRGSFRKAAYSWNDVPSRHISSVGSLPREAMSVQRFRKGDMWPDSAVCVHFMFPVRRLRIAETNFISGRVLGHLLHKSGVAQFPFAFEHPRRYDAGINTSETEGEQLEAVFRAAECELTYLMGVSCYTSRGGPQVVTPPSKLSTWLPWLELLLVWVVQCRHLSVLTVSRRWLWRIVSPDMLRRVAPVRTDISEELSASFISVTRSCN
jgi:hypothetical protein